MGRSVLIAAGAVCALYAFIHGSAHAGFASAVVSYAPGEGIEARFQNPAGAVGMPAGDTTFGVLTPFNPAFHESHIVGIGAGGSLVLALDSTAATGAGHTIGVHAAVGMIDEDWPNGNPGPVATLFNNPRAADVYISDDGARWHALGQRVFDVPTNFYSEGVTTPGYQPEPGTVVADFAKPFAGGLSDFNGQTWPQMLALLDGSAGGEWLDLTDVPYAGVNFIRFDVTTAGESMYVDAVTVIPEPAGALAALAALLPLARRARKDRR